MWKYQREPGKLPVKTNLESTSVRCFFNTNVLNTGHLHVFIGIFKTKGVANQYKNLINLSTIPPISTAASKSPAKKINYKAELG